MSKIAKATWDYKNGEGAQKAILEALNQIGVFAYKAPSCEGSDAFGVIVSKEPLSDAVIEIVDEAE